ncbi:MAG TPA: hypothetical protein VJH70_01055 [Candidatus Paceibacterota bacterium]
MNSLISLGVFLCFSPLLVFLLHVSICRFKVRLPIQTLQILAYLIGFFPLYYVLSFVEQTTAAVVYAFLVYSSFSYTYFHFFNMSETARRIKILYEINRTGFLKEKEILCLYKTSDIVQKRLVRLLDMREIALEAGRYKLQSHLLLAVAILLINWWRLVLGFRDKSE